MLTIFTCPRSFNGHINIIQRNAIGSWLLLNPKPKIILVGNDEGVEGICKEFCLKHVPNIKKNEFGTPLINSIFKESQKSTNNNIMCYVNTDIILMNNFVDTIKSVTYLKKQYLLVGKRIDIDIAKAIEFEKQWKKKLLEYVAENGKLHAPTGKDYFVFPKNLFRIIPNFAIGRGMWDDWLIYQARKQKTPVIDITRGASVFHQNHDYAHIKGLSSGSKRWRKGIETKINITLGGGIRHIYSIEDSNYIYMKDKIIKKPSNYIIKRFIYHQLKPIEVQLRRIAKCVLFKGNHTP